MFYLLYSSWAIILLPTTLYSLKLYKHHKLATIIILRQQQQSAEEGTVLFGSISFSSPELQLSSAYTGELLFATYHWRRRRMSAVLLEQYYSWSVIQ